MKTVVNIRGISGSGKSTLVKMFRDYMGGWEPVWGDPPAPPSRTLGDFLPPDLAEARRARIQRATGKPEGYRIAPAHGVSETYVVGPYEGPSPGCDKMEQDAVPVHVHRFFERGHVVFEGLRVSASQSRYAAFADEIREAGGRFVFAFLDTPFDLCLERIHARGSAQYKRAGIEEWWGRLQRVREWVGEVGHEAVDLPHEDPLPTLVALLREETK